MSLISKIKEGNDIAYEMKKKIANLGNKSY
jgi:hypothetical protein